MPNVQEEPRVPVYLINGFLESGKTSFMDFTLKQEYFRNGEKTLIILCEEGEVELDEKMLEQINAVQVVFDDPADMTPENMRALELKHKPDRVMLEYNGVWKMEDIYNLEMPSGWVIFQVITMVDGSTFAMYSANNNMKSMIVSMVGEADMVIFNRCDADTPLTKFRRSIKAVNSRAQVIFEGRDGEMMDAVDELPYDINADVIEIEDYDYGIFYVDAQEHPEVYDGKTVKFKGMVLKSADLISGVFVPGRHAMTCCAADLQFIGFVCHSKYARKLKSGQWVMVTGRIKYEYVRQYRGNGPVIYADNVSEAEKPADEVVYF
ncbi:MAG: GTPase [Lachnospiraceae bacterium]|nr:GTPase [Lachnospiraceae bacterium]